MDEADLVVRNARVTTLHGNSPEAEAFAVRGEKFVAVGDEAEVMPLAGDGTWLVDAGGRRVIPGLNDSHLHAIRGGLPASATVGIRFSVNWNGDQPPITRTHWPCGVRCACSRIIARPRRNEPTQIGRASCRERV